MAKKKILITGASGMLGAYLVKKWQHSFDIYATGRFPFKENYAKKYLRFDLASESYDKLLEWSKPDIIVHCAAITNLDYCENHPQEAMNINAYSISKMLKNFIPSKFLYISSDAVFPDHGTEMSEKNEISPINIYGKSKKEGERILSKTLKNHLIVRTTIIGKNINTSKSSFLDWLINSLRKNKPITLFDDAIFTPISIWSLAEELFWLLENDLKGIFHIGGSEAISKFNFGMKICSSLGLNINLIKKGSIDDAKFFANRRNDQTLDSTSYELDYKRNLPQVEDILKEINYHFRSNYND